MREWSFLIQSVLRKQTVNLVRVHCQVRERPPWSWRGQRGVIAARDWIYWGFSSALTILLLFRSWESTGKSWILRYFSMLSHWIEHGKYQWKNSSECTKKYKLNIYRLLKKITVKRTSRNVFHLIFNFFQLYYLLLSTIYYCFIVLSTFIVEIWEKIYICVQLL